jgi:hypothetical protein
VAKEHPFLPGTHVAEANDAKPFYNDGNNGNQRVARKKENQKRNGGSSNGGGRSDRRDSSSTGDARNLSRESRPNREESQPKIEKPAGPPKPFTRFKPRD